MNKLLKPLDFALIAAALLCVLGLFGYSRLSTHSATATIRIGGEIYTQIELDKVDEPYELELPCEPKAILLVENGAISFKEADCSDKICVNTGTLKSRGNTAACLPARVVVTIENGEKELDAVV